MGIAQAYLVALRLRKSLSKTATPILPNSIPRAQEAVFDNPATAKLTIIGIDMATFGHGKLQMLLPCA